MELNTLSVQNHDFSANTKVFIIDFDNVNSSRDLVHALTKISMLKYMSMKREAFLDKKEVSLVIRCGLEQELQFLLASFRTKKSYTKLLLQIVISKK